MTQCEQRDRLLAEWLGSVASFSALDCGLTKQRYFSFFVNGPSLDIWLSAANVTEGRLWVFLNG